MTLASTLRRPRCAMPNTISRTPNWPPYLITASSAGIIDLAAVEAEALGADIFAGEEFLPLLRLDHLGEDRLLALGREADLGVLALHPLLQEAPLLDLVDVHIFEADLAAVIGAEDLDELADRRPFEPERAAEIDAAGRDRPR